MIERGGILRDHKSLARVKKVAHWLDSKFRIPGTPVRLGADALIGFVPGIGDTAMLFVSFWIIAEAHRSGVPLRLKLQMIWNVFLDWLIGLMPLIGDIFDVVWRANQRNAEIFEQHVEGQQP